MTISLRSFLRKTGYVCASVIIFIGLILALSQFLSPVLNRHRAQFEALASRLLQLPVSIQKVELSWRHYRPEIIFNEVSIVDPKTKQPTVQIKRISVLLSILNSIRQRTVVPAGFMLSGTSINIHENEPGNYIIPGFPSLAGFKGAPHNTEEKIYAVMGWLSSQNYLILHDIDIHYKNIKQQEYWITLYDLNISNTTTNHTILGKAILHQKIPTEINLDINWQGRTFDLKQIKAKLFIYVAGLSLEQWFKGYSWNSWQANKGLVNAKIWANWDNGTFQKIQTTFSAFNLNLFSEKDKTVHEVNRISGSVGWERQEDMWVIAGDEILIDLADHLWPSSSFYISLIPDAKRNFLPKIIKIGYLDLHDVQLFLASTKWLPENIQKLLTNLEPKGVIENTTIKFGSSLTDWRQINFSGDFGKLSIAAWEKYPGINNLSGQINWDGITGKLKLNSKRLTFTDNSIFVNPLVIGQLKGDVDWKLTPDHVWNFTASDLKISNNDVSATVKGSVSISKEGKTSTDLNADFDLYKANHVSKYLPLAIFHENLRDWLTQAFLSGEVKQGRAQLRGQLDHFPFTNNDGIFIISGLVNHVDFRYAPNWPMLQDVSGKLTFSKKSMLAEVNSAKIMNIPVGKVRGEIADFSSAILKIQSEENIQTDMKEGLKFIHNSPLENNIGKMFKDIEAEGPIALALKLTIPLENPEKTNVLGDLTIKKVNMNAVPWNLSFGELTGQIQFTENSVSSNNIQGKIFNQPLQVKLLTNQIKKHSVIQANFTVDKLSVNDLQSWLKLPFSQVLEGETKVSGSLSFPPNAPMQLHLQSNLVGIEVKLPDRFTKKANEIKNFSLDLFAQEKQPLRLKMTYGDLLNSALILEYKKDQLHLHGINLSFGAPATWPEGAGLTISGKFEKIDWDELQKYIAKSPAINGDGLKIFAIDINVDQVNLLGQQLSQVHFQVTQANKNWNVIINSSNIIGQLQIPMDFSARSMLTGDFKKLYLNSTGNNGTVFGKINVSALPSFSISADDVNFNNIPIGKITFKSSPTSNGLHIDSLQIVSSKGMNLQSTGAWEQTQTGYQTKLQGRVVTTQLSNLLKSFGLDVHNFIVTNGTANFNLSWQDAPYAPSLATLNGDVHIDIGSGRIVDIGNQSDAKMDLGRMLSIFSLQTIPRRLSLNFSDLFQSGYSFDSLKGDVSFQNGEAFTTNLRFDGPIAKVAINGRIGLVNKTYNFILSVSPYVTSSIPVAATLLTGQPLIGLAALAVQTVLGPQVAKVITYHYLVTGPWSNPSWTSVNAPENK